MTSNNKNKRKSLPANLMLNENDYQSLMRFLLFENKKTIVLFENSQSLIEKTKMSYGVVRVVSKKILFNNPFFSIFIKKSV